MRQSGFAQGIIFDFDGVLIDTEPLYRRTINEVLEEANAPLLTVERYKDLIGTSADGIWIVLKKEHELPRSGPYYQQLYGERLKEVLQEGLVLRPEAKVLLAEVAERGLPRGLATSSPRNWADLKLRLLGLEDYFCTVVTAEDVGHSKPEPHIYLRAAAEVGVPTGKAVAIEDSPAGIAAAKAAGIYTFGLRTTATEGVDIGDADEVIDSLSEFKMESIFESAALEGAVACR